MCTVLLSPGVNPIAFNKCIISYQMLSNTQKILALITHCESCCIPHNYSVSYVCQAKCWIHLLLRPFYKNGQKYAFRGLPEVTAFNSCFSEGRQCQQQIAWSDWRNHKRLLMQRSLCCCRRHHSSYDLCWSSSWNERSMQGNMVTIRENIYM